MALHRLSGSGLKSNKEGNLYYQPLL